MNYFLNLKDGQLSINTYRFPSAAATTAEDVVESHKNGSEEALTASIEDEDLERYKALIENT